MSPLQEEFDIPEKSKESELFEFRASENDVIQESAGSSQSIYSAEEVNPEGDNQSNSSNNSGSSSSSNHINSSNNNDVGRGYRHSTGTSSALTTVESNTVDSVVSANQRQQIERSRSLDSQDCVTTIVTQTPQRQHSNNHIFRSRYNSTDSNTPSTSSSENSSPTCERSNNASRRVHESNINCLQQQQQQQQLHRQQQITATSPVLLSPPAWIPDEKAPRCMSCNTPFTAFRRRHHCRNCGGVFCGVCSNMSAPLPKYGLTKAVRVCRACYVHELCSNASTAVRPTTLNTHNHHHNHHSLVSQTATTSNTANTNNNEPRFRRPVTTTRTFE